MGTGELKGEGLEARISIPGKLEGPGIGTNPEELLISAAMTCYMITLAAILEKRNIPIASLTLESEGILTVENGNLGFRQIIHRPRILLLTDHEKAIQTANLAAHRAEQVCMITKALRGNVDISVEPVIEVQAEAQPT